MHRVMIQLHKKYGSLVRTGPNEVSVSEPSVIRTIYGLLPWVRRPGHSCDAYHTQALDRSSAKAIGIVYGRVVELSICSQSAMKAYTLHSED